MTDTGTVTSYRDGQVYVNEFNMSAPNGRSINLIPVCGRASIYESMLSPTVIAEFIIYDAKGIFNHFIFEEQKIILEFNTNNDNDESAIRYEFYPIKVDPAIPSPDDKGITYKITCITFEAHKSATLRNLPLVRRSIECENMVKACLDVLEAENPKNYFFEKTRGLHAFNFTGKTPFECIDEIRVEYAISQEHNGHAFTFFENKYGFVFKTIEQLIKEGKEKIGDKYFIQSTLASADITGSKWRNILAFKVIQNGNQGIARRIGAGKNLVQEMNRVTGEIIPWDTDPTRLEFETLNDRSITSTLEAANKINKDEGATALVMIDPEVENARRAEKKNHLPYYMQHFLTTVSHITIYGDSTITVGDVITCELPEYDSMTQGEENPIPEANQMVAGNYLVTKCHHILTFGEASEYMQALELVKDGIGGDTPQVSFV